MAGQRHNPWTLAMWAKTGLSLDEETRYSLSHLGTLGKKRGRYRRFGRLESVLPDGPDGCHWNVCAASFGLPARGYSRSQVYVNVSQSQSSSEFARIRRPDVARSEHRRLLFVQMWLQEGK